MKVTLISGIPYYQVMRDTSFCGILLPKPLPPEKNTREMHPKEGAFCKYLTSTPPTHEKQRNTEKQSQTRGNEGDITTKRNVVS